MKLQYSSLLLLAFFAFSFLKPDQTKAQCVTGAETNAAHPKKEMRGVFIPSVVSISWPTNRFATPAVQRAELITILDKIVLNGYNAVFLQVRPESDALYASTIDPWSYWLTGAQGTAPSPLWDPLEFAINESHSRGLELHAWLNPYRAKRGVDVSSPDHVTNEHPDWIFTASNNANLKIVNPGIPAVEDYIVSVVEDIATRYNVDGIHFDDYFYPSGGMGNNQDAQTYIDYNPTNISNINDWRRDNVNEMIGSVYDAIQTINSNNNKNVVFGVSPAGIWKSGTPPGIVGSSAYSALYCDPIAWMQAGKVDYIAPQLYWAFGGGQDYDILSQWWNDQADLYNTQVYVSQAYYKINGGSWPASEAQDQVDENREASMDATFGQIAYRYNEIGSNLHGINDALNGTQFQYKSFVAPITGAGKDAVCALKPDNIRFGDLKVMWDTPAVASDGDLPQKYVVYAFNNASDATNNKNNGAKILDIVAGNELALSQSQIDNKFIVVTSLDKNNNEAGDFCIFPLKDITAACSVTSITAPSILKNCSSSRTGTTSATFPIESTTVITWSYNLGGGETFTQSQNVIIEDTTAPNVITQNISVTLTGAITSITASDINNGSNDNCAIETMSIDIASFTCSDVGVQVVMLTVVDKNGNSASASANVTVESEITEYITSSWSNGFPHKGSLAKFSSSYSTNQGSIEVCACEVAATSTMTVEANHYLKVEGDITVDGILNVAHQGNVVQIDDAAVVINNGTINVNVTTPSLVARDFMLMGSPMTSEDNSVFTDMNGAGSSAYQVLNHTTANFNPYVGTPPVVGVNFHDQESNDWTVLSGPLISGEGYLVRPSYTNNGTYDYQFNQGTLNNGVITYSAFFGDDKEDSPNIISNPYASAIDADILISTNSLIDEIYFWEHNTTPASGVPGPLGENFNMDDISTRNLGMGIPAATGGTTPNGIISTGQGFGIKANAAGNVMFNNALRLTSGNTTLRKVSDADKIWIEVRENVYGLGSTTGVSFSENASSEIDAGYDTMKLGTVVSLYSHLQDGSEQLGIQGREIFDSGITIPMGFSTLIEADAGIPYTIAVADVEGLNIENADVYLIDHYTNMITNIKTGHYVFTSDAGTFDNRFTLLFESLVLDTNVSVQDAVSIYPNPTENIVNIVSPNNVVDSIEVYDLSGRMISRTKFSSEKDYQLDMSSFESAIYFLKINTYDGAVTKRIIKK
ncbi:family 10 glycosylhydrolase [Ulvibacter antarcticus]|uniref:Putative secreted protein (Por secretion system target) n=1 Tax=Ulvibacter antarcticus TaxID=442714 RepID=A0A3L9YEK4_9FLAO|nr:family 10 glycosylhydrolase [Ulvibacter antarcticus]RMA58814.1 putative secreted protein (Por secretion system target) [Ulvibacter antarcticus]